MSRLIWIYAVCKFNIFYFFFFFLCGGGGREDAAALEVLEVLKRKKKRQNLPLPNFKSLQVHHTENSKTRGQTV